MIKPTPFPGLVWVLLSHLSLWQGEGVIKPSPFWFGLGLALPPLSLAKGRGDQTNPNQVWFHWKGGGATKAPHFRFGLGLALPPHSLWKGESVIKPTPFWFGLGFVLCLSGKGKG